MGIEKYKTFDDWFSEQNKGWEFDIIYGYKSNLPIAESMRILTTLLRQYTSEMILNTYNTSEN